MKKLLLTITAVSLGIASLLVSDAAFATNGMNLEGYGPIATGMGGASMAYDNGVAAVMNNPATLGLMPDGDRLDVAVGYLGPHVKSSVTGMESKSAGDAYFMPAIGWARKSGLFSYGFGIFSQGGMGTDYDANSFLALGSGDSVRSELGVGRVIVPVTYNITPELVIGGSVDFVWSSLDLKMAASVADLSNMMTNCTGPLCTNLGFLPVTNWARLDFSNGGDFSGAATGTGIAGKIGATYRINSAISVGAAYHSKTGLDDLETKDSKAMFSAEGAGPAVPGKITVRDFEWPETYAVGLSWNANEKLMIAADIKRINWKDVMKSFKMTYEGAASTVDFAMPQNWKNQTVYEIGIGYRVTNAFTARLGANIADNPIPDTYLNPLFPAIVENHYTIGGGYAVDKASSVDVSFAYAPSVEATNGAGIKVEHSQTNAQIMYSYRF